MTVAPKMLSMNSMEQPLMDKRSKLKSQNHVSVAVEVAVIAVVVAVIAVAVVVTTKEVGKKLFLLNFKKAHHFRRAFFWT